MSPVACRGEKRAGQAGEHGEGGGRATHPVLPQWMLFQFLIFSIKHLLVLFRSGLVCICKDEPQNPSAASVFQFQDSGDRWAGRAWVSRFGFAMDEALAWRSGNGLRGPEFLPHLPELPGPQ